MKKIAIIGIFASTVGVGAAAAHYAIKKAVDYGYWKGRVDEMKSVVPAVDEIMKYAQNVYKDSNRLENEISELEDEMDDLERDYYSLEDDYNELIMNSKGTI